jgi:hypothetical protein
VEDIQKLFIYLFRAYLTTPSGTPLRWRMLGLLVNNEFQQCWSYFPGGTEKNHEHSLSVKLVDGPVFVHDTAQIWSRSVIPSISLLGVSSSWKANRISASQEFPTFHGTQRFITVFMRAYPGPVLTWWVAGSPAQTLKLEYSLRLLVLHTCVCSKWTPAGLRESICKIRAHCYMVEYTFTLLWPTLKACGERFALVTVLQSGRSRNSSVGTGWTVWFRFRAMQEFSLLHSFQTDRGAHLASYQMGAGGNFSEGKTAGAWSWPSPPSNAEVKKGRAIPPLPHMSSWHSA